MSLKYVPKGSINTIPGIGADNGLAPASRYINQCWLVYWRKHAFMS